MATLTIKLEESKTESKGILMIECTNDIAESIIVDTEDWFADDIKNTGGIIPGEFTTKIQMILTDPDKINHMRKWLGFKLKETLGIENPKTSK